MPAADYCAVSRSQRRRWEAYRSSTTTDRRHACSHLERWRRRRGGRAEDRGTRLDVEIFASRPDGVRATGGGGETPRMEAQRPPAVEPPFGLVAERLVEAVE